MTAPPSLLSFNPSNCSLHHNNPSLLGAYISIEGINGSGKSSLLQRLKARLESEKMPHHLTSEPGGTGLGKSLRTLLLEKPEECAPLTEAFLFAANRAQLIHEIVNPYRRRGIHILSDRSLYSSIAFQGFGRKLPLESIITINRIAIQEVVPEHVVLLDLSLNEANQRLAQRSAGDRDAFEEEAHQFQERVRNGFLELYRANPSTWTRIDASKSPEEVTELAWSAIYPLLCGEHR
jgi:dTMP kinase